MLRRHAALLTVAVILMIFSVFVGDSAITGNAVIKVEEPKLVIKYLVVTMLILFIIVLIQVLSMILQEEPKQDNIKSERLERIEKLKKELEEIKSLTS